MHAIGVSSGVFLFYLLVLLPALALKSARAFNAPAGDPVRTAIPSLARIYRNTIVMWLLLFALAWFTARTFDYQIFVLPRLGIPQLLAGVGALLFAFALMFASHAMRSPEELGDMAIDRMLPRSSRERALYSVMAVVAGVAEEAAYRGVLLSILWYALGNPWLAVFIASLAFAAGHALQGWKSMVVIFVMACSMHALVWYTGTLVIAMVVHALYDLLVPTLRRRIWPALPTDPGRIAG